MKKDNIVQIKSYEFTIRIVKAYKFLCEEKKEFILSKQLLPNRHYTNQPLPNRYRMNHQSLPPTTNRYRTNPFVCVSHLPPNQPTKPTIPMTQTTHPIIPN